MGQFYSVDFSNVYYIPLTLPQAGRLVYSMHDYSWSQHSTSEETLHSLLGYRWGFLVTHGQPFTAPVWVSEFGEFPALDLIPRVRRRAPFARHPFPFTNGRRVPRRAQLRQRLASFPTSPRDLHELVDLTRSMSSLCQVAVVPELHARRGL